MTVKDMVTEDIAFIDKQFVFKDEEININGNNITHFEVVDKYGSVLVIDAYSNSKVTDECYYLNVPNHVHLGVEEVEEVNTTFLAT